MRLRWAIPMVASLGACTSAPVQPAISDFSAAVGLTTAAIERRYQRDEIAALHANEFDQEMVDSLAFYSAENCSSPIGLSIRLNDPALSDFSQHCTLQTQAIIDGEISDFEVEIEDGFPGITGENALRLSGALAAYAAALNALAGSDSPAQIARDFDVAAAAVLNLVDDAKRLGRAGDTLADPDRALAEAGTELGSAILQGIYETRRYNLLHTLVEESDPAVQLTSRAIAGWYRSETSGEIVAAYGDLLNAISEQQKSIADLRRGEGDTTIAIEASRDVRLAYDRLAQLETNAPWRTHLAVAEAHAAIFAALEAPANLDALAHANDRIDNLVTKTQAFVEAIEARDEEDS